MAVTPLAALRDAAIVREPDRYFAATLAPEAVRYDLIVLAAFASELGNIPSQAREPLAGEIRLQWWRDALVAKSGDAAAGHPIAMALRTTIARHALPTELVEGAIDSHADLLHGDRPVDENALRSQIAASEGGIFGLAAYICRADGIGDLRRITHAAGLAYGLSRTLLRAAAFGPARLPIPRSLLSDEEMGHIGPRSPVLAAAITRLSELACTSFAGIEPELANMARLQRLPFLPLVMVRPNLRALEIWSKQCSAPPIEPMQIGRLLRMTWAHAWGRF